MSKANPGNKGVPAVATRFAFPKASLGGGSLWLMCLAWFSSSDDGTLDQSPGWSPWPWGAKESHFTGRSWLRAFWLNSESYDEIVDASDGSDGLFGGCLNGYQRILRGHADKGLKPPENDCLTVNLNPLAAPQKLLRLKR
jgi:hypothetical protein